MLVNIQTTFYDEKERKAFEANYPNHYVELETFIAASPRELSYADFQAYYLFKFWRDSHTVWGSFKGIRSRVSNQWAGLDDFFKHDAATSQFNSREPDNNEQAEHSEGVGVAGALTLLSSHHGLTEADWERIPATNEKDFDYKIASTGSSFVYVECKGSITSDNSDKAVTYSHKSNIVAKKKSKVSVGPRDPRDILYGIITVADPVNHLKSWFVDPPEPSNSDDPRRHKLLARLYFYYRNLYGLYQRSPFVVALINRIRVIERSSDYTSFDKLHLLSASGERYFKSKVFLQGYTAKGSEVFGKAVLLGRPEEGGRLMFFGFLREVLGFLCNQNIEETLAYSTSTQQSRRRKLNLFLDRPNEVGFRLNLTISRKSPEAEFLTSIGKAGSPKSAYITISCTVDLQISAAGRAFGLIQTDSIQPK